MAEQDTETDMLHPCKTDSKEDSTPSISLSQDPARDEHKQNNADSAPDVTEDHSEDSESPSTPADRGAEISGTQGTQPTEVEGQGLDSKPDVEKSCSAEHSDRSHGDHRGNAPAPKPGEASEDDHSGEKKAPERSHSPALNDTKDHSGEKKAPERSHSSALSASEEDFVDGHEAQANEKPLDRDDTHTGEGEDNTVAEVSVSKAAKDSKNNTVSMLKPQSQKEEEKIVEQRNRDAETIGPEEKTPEPTAPKATVIHGANVKYWMLVAIVALCSVLLHHLYQSETPPEKKDVRQVDIFLRELEIVKTQFPSQRSELWRRSRIHLARHLQTAQPTEPVSLILTAGTKAEGTLRCLAQALASAFSAALNSSVLQIDGASKANQDSDQVKLDIDSQLRAAFEGDKPVAVVHRFDELPPASTLIFYRYCDHENAAYKKTSLMFTVLLGGEDELPAHLGLSAVEEMVDDQLKKKFLSSSQTIAFDRMDLDKYGGLWSRISHLILPVASEKRIEHKGC